LTSNFHVERHLFSDFHLSSFVSRTSIFGKILTSLILNVSSIRTCIEESFLNQSEAGYFTDPVRRRFYEHSVPNVA
jgi:hypothetical protein